MVTVCLTNDCSVCSNPSFQHFNDKFSHVTISRRSAMMNSLKTFATGALRAAGSSVSASNGLLTTARALPVVQSKGMLLLKCD